MAIPSIVKTSSERGIALVVVLLLMAVLSGLATGFAMTGNIEVQMGTNEVYYAGARAAAEAGLNRAIVAIVADNSTDWLAGIDGLVDEANAAAAVNADNGQLDFILGAGPYALDAAGDYTYDIEILDDDNPVLYTAFTDEQRTAMEENITESIYTDDNDRMILRATGFGPNGTTVRIARVLTSDTGPITPVNSAFDAAIIVNGNFEMNGAVTINGLSGSVHANGNLSKTGSGGTITGTATTSGTYTGAEMATGGTSAGAPTVTIPDIQASNYEHLADYKLTNTGTVQTMVGGVWTDCTSSACKGIGWTFSGSGASATWSTGKTPSAATFFVDAKVSIGPTSGSSNKPVSIIATGDIDVNSNQAKLTPHANNIQFVTDGDLTINASDLDLDASVLEGEIRVRGQMDAGGNMSFQGRVMVQDVPDAGTAVANGASRIHGSVTFTYNGSLGADAFVETPGTPTFTNNIEGWMEQ
jgi:hypothetical protein